MEKSPISPEAPKIRTALVPTHLLGTEQCEGVGKRRKATLQSYMPQFKTAVVTVECDACHMTLPTEVKYK